ncbi:MAG: type II secretion system protein [Planctomycetota bacterium]
MNRRSRRSWCARGLTIIEVLVSIAILGGIASMVFGVIGFQERAAAYDTHRINAMEIAHRTVVQWIDDPQWIRSQPKRYEYMGRFYVFDVQEMVLVNDEASGGTGVAVGSARSEDESSVEDIVQSALRVLDVRVWLEDAELEGVTTTDEPLVHMTRTYWLGATERGREELFRMLMERMQEGRAGG